MLELERSADASFAFRIRYQNAQNQLSSGASLRMQPAIMIRIKQAGYSVLGQQQQVLPCL